jgi:hypothetical protein
VPVLTAVPLPLTSFDKDNLGSALDSAVNRSEGQDAEEQESGFLLLIATRPLGLVIQVARSSVASIGRNRLMCIRIFLTTAGTRSTKS